MKNVLSTGITSSSQQPYTKTTHEWYNAMSKDVAEAFVKSLIPSSAYTGKLVILSGCALTGTNPGARTVADGWVWYNGEIFRVNSGTFTTGVGEIGIWSINTSYTNLTFSDGASKPVHQERTFVITNGAMGSGLFNEDSTNVVRYDGIGENYIETTTNNGETITASSSITITGLTNYFSYYIKNKVCHLDFDIQFTVTSGAVVSYIRIPIPQNIIKKITGTNPRYSQKGTAHFIAPSGTTNYTTLYVNSCDDVSDGQYLQIKRASDGDTDITMSTVATTIKGHIIFRIE